MARIVIHIDRLILRGIDGADAEAVSAGVSSALAEALGDPARRASLVAQGNRARVNAGKVNASTAAESTGRAVGARIAGVMGA